MSIENSSDPSAPRRLVRDVWPIVAPILAVGLLAMSMGIVAGAFSAGKFGFGFWLALGLAASLVLSVRWHRLLDEHERAAYDFDAVTAIYAYFFLSVGWWLLWRAALVPSPDGIAIFALVMMTWMVGWLIRRFR